MYVLHALPDSAGLVVHCVLREMGVPFRLNMMERSSGERDTTAYRAMQPEGKVPVLETPEGPIFETGAILIWLGEKHPSFAPAPGAPERAAFLKWLVYTNNALHTTVMELAYPDRHVQDEASIPTVVGAAASRLDTHLDILDAMAASRPDWCSPDRATILGYYVSMLHRWVMQFPADHPAHRAYDRWPALAELARGMERRPAALAAAEIEGLGATVFSSPER